MREIEHAKCDSDIAASWSAPTQRASEGGALDLSSTCGSEVSTPADLKSASLPGDLIRVDGRFTPRSVIV